MSVRATDILIAATTTVERARKPRVDLPLMSGMTLG
jgi:hypothetical protein